MYSTYMQVFSSSQFFVIIGDFETLLLTDLNTLYTVDATEFVTAQIDATFHEGRGNGERLVNDYVNFTGINARMSGS